MTRIDFYSNAESLVHVACQLAAKAFASGLTVVLLSPEESLTQTLDRQLWTFQATGFVPHCRAEHHLSHETPVVIAPRIESTGKDGLLINLGSVCPPGFGRFQRLIEIVGEAEADRLAGRARWRHYKERGYLVSHVDLSRGRSAVTGNGTLA